jgi:hypothetical protein
MAVERRRLTIGHVTASGGGILAPVSARQVEVLAAIAGGCGLAVAVSFTKPFTFGADLLTAVALAAMVVAQVVVELRSRRTPPESAAAVPFASLASRFRRCVLWIATCVAFTGLELFTYTGHPRREYPTFSSLSDDVSASQAGRAILFIAWLCLGWLFLSASVRRKRAKQPVGGS